MPLDNEYRRLAPLEWNVKLIPLMEKNIFDPDAHSRIHSRKML